MKANKLINGLILVLIGIILLANTLGVLEWSVWLDIVRFWPLLLVSWGISLIFRGKRLSFLAPLIIFLGIILGVIAGYTGISPEGRMVRGEKILAREIVREIEKTPEIEVVPETETKRETKVPPGVEVIPEIESTEPPEEMIPKVIEKEYVEIEKASITLKLKEGTLAIGGTTPLLYECTSSYGYKEFEPFEQYSTAENNKKANILIYHSPVKGNFGNPQNNRWKLKLNNQPIYDLNLETEVANIDCNLSEFKVEKLYIKSGASNIKLKVPKCNSQIIVETGASNLDLLIPQNVGTIVHINSGMAIKNLENFIQRDEAYISTNYEEAEFKTEIKIDCGISFIDINYADLP